MNNDSIALIFSFELFKWLLHEKRLEPIKIKPDKKNADKVVFYYNDNLEFRLAYYEYKRIYPTRNNTDILFLNN